MPFSRTGLPWGQRPPVAMCAALTIVAALGACGHDAPKAPAAQRVEVAHPLERRIVDWDDYVGRFEAVQDAQIRPRVSGQILRVMLQPGQHVRQGQPLFEIDPRPYRAALAQAQAEVARADAVLLNARQERLRAAQLVTSQAISREELEQKQASERTAIAGLAAARAAERTRALDVEFTLVRAPISGLISDKQVSIGDYVSAGQTPLTRVVSLDPIRFTFDGAESLYLKYMREAANGGRPSSRTSPNPIDIQLADDKGYSLHGRMDFVDNAIDTTSGTIRAHALVPNPGGRLVPGLFGRARLVGSATYPALLLPDAAIVTDQTRQYVFVVGSDGKAAIRNVTTGPMIEGLRVVRQGLTARDKVVIEGITRLQAGAALSAHPGHIEARPDAQGPVSAPAQAPAPQQATTPRQASR
ncbi:MAG TPA: efflux RND transporter periplasmic adaptor subunit [Novosphingobium sp.]|nr:efflux RND transporter periplasmic adaptor subunit [Novosphingobium sp.]